MCRFDSLLNCFFFSLRASEAFQQRHTAGFITYYCSTWLYCPFVSSMTSVIHISMCETLSQLCSNFHPRPCPVSLRLMKPGRWRADSPPHCAHTITVASTALAHQRVPLHCIHKGPPLPSTSRTQASVTGVPSAVSHLTPPLFECLTMKDLD